MKRSLARWALSALCTAGAACREGGDAATDARRGEDAAFDLPTPDRPSAACDGLPAASDGGADGAAARACTCPPEANARGSSFRSTRLAPESRGGHHASLAIGERGATHVLYSVTQDAAYTYAVHDGCRWRFERIAGVRTGYPFERVRLRLGAGDVPHALASPVDGIRGIAYGRRRADGWIFEAIPTAGEPGEVGDMALDVDGQPHLCLSFRAPSTETSYAYAVRRGDRWMTQEIARDREPPRLCAIEVDRGGRAHIVWSVERAAGSVRYTAGHAGGFTTRIIDPQRVDGGAGAPVSLALDPAGRPWIFHQVAGQGLSYDTRDDAGWSSGVVAADAYLPSSVAASVDGRGQPTVAARVGERVVTFHRAGTGWTRSDVSDGGVGTYVALATAPDGSLRAATSSASTTSGGVRVGRFDRGAWNLELVDPAVSTFGPATLRQGADGLSSVHVENGTNGVAGAHLVVMDQSPSGGWTRSSPWPDEGVRTFDAAVDARGALHVA